MLAGVLAGCKKDVEENEDSDSSDSVYTEDGSTNEDTIPPEYVDELPELNYGGKAVRILSRDATGATDEITVKRTNGNAVNDAVYKRQVNVEERLGIKISNDMVSAEGDTWAVMRKYIALQKAGEDAYDIVAGVMYRSCVGLLTDKTFHDLNNEDISKYLNLDKYYWSQLANEALSYNGAQYLCTGHAALTMYRYLFATYFNINTFNDAGIDLYDIVDKGQWTLEEQRKIATQLSEERNGDATIEAGTDDKVGFLTSWSVSIDPYWSSCGLKVLEKNTNDTYDLMLYGSSNYDRLSRTLKNLVDMKNQNGIVMLAYKTGDAEQEDIATYFSKGNVAMATLRLVASESASLTNIKYGVVPIAKLDAGTDTEYYSYVHDQVTGFGVPSIIPLSDTERLQMIGAFLEAMGSESYKTLRPAYYEKVLKGRYLSDDKSMQMLDYIVEHLKMDAGILYTQRLDSIHQCLRFSVRDGDTSLATYFGNKQSTVTTKFNDLKKELSELNNG